MCRAAPGLGSHEEVSEMRASQGKTVWPVYPSMTATCCQTDRAVEHKRNERNKTVSGFVILEVWGKLKSMKHKHK